MSHDAPDPDFLDTVGHILGVDGGPGVDDIMHTLSTHGAPPPPPLRARARSLERALQALQPGGDQLCDLQFEGGGGRPRPPPPPPPCDGGGAAAAAAPVAVAVFPAAPPVCGGWRAPAAPTPHPAPHAAAAVVGPDAW